LSRVYSDELILLTDGSVNTLDKVGYGATLLIDSRTISSSMEELKEQIKVKRFDQTSSTKLELQTLLWVLRVIPKSTSNLTIYTDSQNIIGLPARRERLEHQDFCSSSGKTLNHADLYREFYHLTDQLNCIFVKVRGHQPTQTKDIIDRLFTLVDRAARSALRAN
jgi:ribonuclease HI